MVDGIGGLVEKMRSMPMIQSTPNQFLWRGSRGRLDGAPKLPIGARGDQKWQGLMEARARVSVVPAEMSEREGGGEALGFSGGGWSSYRHQVRRPSSRASRRRRRIGRSPVLHRAACRPEVEDDQSESVSGSWVGPTLGFSQVGYGQVNYSFFSSSIFFCFTCFLFLVF
jgi:hypothetical protein